MAADGDKPAERHVSVSATGSVAADPDMATISTGVVVEADTAKEALARNSTVMAKLIDGLKALGIAPKDIQTTAVNVEPRYVQAKDGRPATINGYRVVNQVRLTVRDVKRLGEILDRRHRARRQPGQRHRLRRQQRRDAQGRGAQAGDGERQAPGGALCHGRRRAAGQLCSPSPRT